MSLTKKPFINTATVDEQFYKQFVTEIDKREYVEIKQSFLTAEYQSKAARYAESKNLIVTKTQEGILFCVITRPEGANG